MRKQPNGLIEQIYEMFTEVYREIDYDDFTIHGQTKQHFLHNGGTEEEWKFNIEDGETDQAHTFGSYLLENATIDELTNLLIRYIAHRWEDYVFFVGDAKDYEEFIAFLEEHSPVLSLLSTDCIDSLADEAKKLIF